METTKISDVEELKSKCEELYLKRNKELFTYSQKVLEVATDYKTIKAARFWYAYSLILYGDYHKAENELEKLVQIYPDDEIYIIDVYNSISWMGNMTGMFETISKYGKHALDLSIKNKYLKGEADACNNLGAYHENKGNYSIGLDYHFKALNIRKEHDKKSAAGSLGNIGNIYYAQGNLGEALKYHLESFALDQLNDNKRGMSISLNNIGNVYEESGNAEEALKNFKAGLDLSLEIGNDHGLGILYLNIGNVYSKKKNFNEALNYHQKSLDIKERIGDYYGIAWSLFSLAEIYIELKDFELAGDFVIRGMKVNEKVQGIEFDIWYYSLMGKIFDGQQKFTNAIEFYKEAYNKAIDKGRKVEAKVNLESLYKAFESNNDPINAFHYFKLYHQLEKEVLGEESIRYVASVKYTAEIEQKKYEAEVERLRNVELKSAYEDLESSHRELKSAQDELIQKERMAAIGKIASEIAHEVQNPLNFVNNFSELNSEIVKELIDEVKAHGLTESAKDLIENLNKNSDSINLNGKRVAGIVSQLLELTRKGEF